MCPVCLGDLCKYILELELEMLRLGPTRAVCMYVSMYWYVCMYVLVCTGMYWYVSYHPTYPPTGTYWSWSWSWSWVDPMWL